MSQGNIKIWVAPTLTEILVRNVSLDITIRKILVKGNDVVYVSGTDLPISAGDPDGFFSTTDFGTHTVEIEYDPCLRDQSIRFFDSNNDVTCHNTDPAGGRFTITNAVIAVGTTMIIEPNDGIC